ncbi:hypothetical protein L7F22_017264 [Adiantum nelumboides]|nr:hypothetical protein [Adiantum nelumboides]
MVQHSMWIDLSACVEGFKKESEEYIEETQKDALSLLSHGATQLTIECNSQAIPLNKDKGHKEPPSTSRIPTSFSMPVTTSSMAPSTSYMPATTPPMAPTPSSMVATSSSLVHTTSFVVESLLGRELWERRPITRSVGFQYQTIVDTLLMDISQIDKFVLTSINKFFATQKTNVYNRDGVPCREVARLIFADFLTGLLVDDLSPAPLEGMGVLKWNTFSMGLVTWCMDLAREFLTDEGFLVTMDVAKHIGDFIVEASRVLDLTMCLWYYAGYLMPCYDRETGETIAERLFRADRSYMIDDCVCPIDIESVIARGRAERSSLFFRWLLATFTKPMIMF